MITYPLTPPAAFSTASSRWVPVSSVQQNKYTFTGARQVSAIPCTYWEVEISIPAMPRDKADSVEGFLLALNGAEGTFWYRDVLRPTTKGTASGSWTVGSGCVANSSTLPTSGSGSLSVGDWLQVGNQLLRVAQVNSGSVDVFPKLRQAYASGTPIIYTNPKGLFAQKSVPSFDVGTSRNFGPYNVSLAEVV